MKKMRLELEELAVESFETAGMPAERGTVQGQEITARCSDFLAECTERTCGGYTCDGPSCPALSCDACGSYYCATADYSCGAFSCVYTCAVACSTPAPSYSCLPDPHC